MSDLLNFERILTLFVECSTFASIFIYIFTRYLWVLPTLLVVICSNTVFFGVKYWISIPLCQVRLGVKKGESNNAAMSVIAVALKAVRMYGAA